MVTKTHTYLDTLIVLKEAVERKEEQEQEDEGKEKIMKLADRYGGKVKRLWKGRYFGYYLDTLILEQTYGRINFKT